MGTVTANTTQPVPYQNGTATMKRRPVSDAGVIEQPQPQHQPQPQMTAAPRRNSVDQVAPGGNEGGPVRKPKPPVSPKPVVAQIKSKGGPPTPPQPVSNRRVPLPGPGTPGSPGNHSTLFTHQSGKPICFKANTWVKAVSNKQTSHSRSTNCDWGIPRHSKASVEIQSLHQVLGLPHGLLPAVCNKMDSTKTSVTDAVHNLIVKVLSILKTKSITDKEKRHLWSCWL